MRNFFLYNGIKPTFFVFFLNFLLFNSIYCHANGRLHIRGARYCEIILDKSLTNYSVYNTWGFNDCPKKLWNAMTVDSVKKETGASLVHLNGPRYWVIDGYKNTKRISKNTKKIGGMMFGEAGILHLSLFDLLKSYKPYKIRKVDRYTTWIYQMGMPAYELIDDKGTIYLMQSYSVQKNYQTLKSLSRLGQQLKLPTGWHFKTGLLKKQETLQARHHKAFVVQDDFGNTYQLAPHDFL